MAAQNPLDALDDTPAQPAPQTAALAQNPLDALDEQPTPAGPGPNPLDHLEEPPASAATAERMRDVTDQAQMPEVTVSAKRSRPAASWSQVAAGIPTAIGAGIESKIAGAQEFLGRTAYDDARKKFWQATILPQAVRDAKQQNVALTDLPEVQDTARHLGIRPDTFTRDWPTYVNQPDEQLNDFKAQQRDRLQAGAQQIASGTRKRLTAQEVREAYAPNMDEHSLKSLVFDAATMAPDVLAGVAGTVATGGAGGAAIMAADIAPNMYAEARNRGLNHDQASTYAVLSTLASSVPEVPVLKIVENTPFARKVIGGIVGEKLASTGVGKVAGTAAAQGVTQSVVNALQQGIDAGALNEHLPLNEALKQVAWSGLVGGVVGAPMGAYHAATSRERKPTTFLEHPEVGGGNGVDETAPGLAAGEVSAAAEDPSISMAAEPPQEVNRASEANPEEEQAPSVAPPSVERSPAPIEPPAEQKGDTEAKNNSPTPEDERAALQAVKNKTVTPPQAAMLEDLGLVRRNDLGEPLLLPKGRRRIAELNAMGDSADTPKIPVQTVLKGGETGSEPPISTVETPAEPEKQAEVSRNEPEPAQVPAQERTNGPATTENRIATDQDLRDGLTAMKAETGWAQVGGRVMRDATTDQVSGRTTWIPNAEWWPGRPKGLKEAEVHAAIDKALAGQPLRRREQAMVDYMTHVHDERAAMAQTHQELVEAVPDLPKQPEGSLDLTLLASRAAEFDSNEAARIMDTWEDDKPETIARVRGQFEQIIGRGHGNQESLELTSQEGGAGQPAPAKRTPAALDLFGEDRTREQALADETQRRDAQRSPNRDVPVETGLPGDLFSQSRRQVDFTDQLKQARAETHTEPSEGQKVAGNYSKGRINFGGMEVALENPKGSTRSGVGDDGRPWSSRLKHDYGYFAGTEGADGDALDVFLTGKPDTGKMYVINQVDPESGKFDEIKAIGGAESAKEAQDIYHANYPRGWKGLGSMAEVPTAKFKQWSESGNTHNPYPGAERVERREAGGARRAKVAEMSPEQLRKELLTHELTGIQNRRAYVESEKLPTQVSIDVDSLKAVNDTAGHHAGDDLLKAVGQALRDETEHAYHLSGDEFAVQALHSREANAIMQRVTERLKNAEIIVDMPDGRVLSLKGLGVSFGVGEDLAKADAALQAHKKQREAEGSRAPRGKAPPGLTVRPAETGREDRGRAPATEEVKPKSRRSEPTTGLPRAHIERIVHQTIREANLVSGFPHVEVHEDVSSLPEHIKSLIEQQGAQGLTGAVYDPSTGRIHLIAANNGSESEVRENLWHEAVGHHGLRLAMDRPQYNAIMDGIARDMPERVEASAQRNGLDLGDLEQKRAAAEEVVAYAAGQQLSGQSIDKPVLPYWTRAVRAVKAFFSRMAGKPFYDDTAIAGLIQQAHQALERRFLTVSNRLRDALSETATRLRAGFNSAHESGLDREVLPALRASDLNTHVATGITFPESLGGDRGIARGDFPIGQTEAALGAEPRGRAPAPADEERTAELADFARWHEGLRGQGASMSEHWGFQITPEMKQAALGEGFPMFARRQQPLPLEENRERGAYAAVRRALNAVHDSKAVRDVRKLGNPVGMSQESKQVAQIARSALGELAHETVQTQEALEHFSRDIDKLPITDQLEMMDAIERGAEQPHPDLQPVADEMRKTLDTWREKVRGLGDGYLDHFIENYFPHYWRDESEAQRMVASIMGRRPLRGPASFLKMRTIPSIKEGMDAGLTPLTTNPLIMTLLKAREMQRFVTGVTLMRRFKEDGLARFLRSGLPMPDGWAPINDSIAKVRQWSEAEAGFIDRGQYIMPVDAARVINNHLSGSALRDFAPAQIFRRGANALNALQLGFSAFHLGFTTLDAMISKNAQGIERLMHGDVAGAAKSFGEGVTPVGAVRNVHRGYKLLEAYSDPVGATPEMAKLVKMLELAGGRAHMDRYYLATEGFSPFRGVGVRSLASDIHKALTAPQDKLERLGQAVGSFPAEYGNKLWKGLQEIWQTTPAMEVPIEVTARIVRASTAWIMEHLVPMQKLGVFSDLAADHLQRNPVEDPNARAAAMQRIWDSVDNRLGEMVYDNLFWNRTLKDTLHLGIRAVGWNLGTIREIGGAPVDLVKAVNKRLTTGELSAADLGHRIPYVLAMTATTALYAAVYQYLATGQGPQELKDYFFPRTGGLTNYGTPQRVSLPSYVKDVYEYSQQPGTTVVNKLNPIFSLIGNLYSNQDFFGNPITDPEADYWHKKLQQLEFVGKEATPFSFQGRQQMQASEQGGGIGATVRKVLPMVGVTPAPGYITSPDQIERRNRLEQDKKYTSELKYKMKRALLAKDKAGAKVLATQYAEAVKRMSQTQKLVDQDKGKAAAARRKAAISMRQAGLPATANLVASLPLDPDHLARQYFTQQSVTAS